MPYAKSFAAGFVSTLVFHQGALWLLARANASITVWNLAPVPPLGIPSVISLAFWGGLWGVVLWALIRSARGASYWIKAVAIGALGPTAVAMFVVAPLKGRALAFGWDPAWIVGGLIVNAAWGAGVGLLMRLFNRR